MGKKIITFLYNHPLKRGMETCQTYTFEEIKPGMQASFQKKVSEDEVRLFSQLTEDRNPLHLNEEYAKETPFKNRVVFGQLVQAYLSTIAGMYLPGKYSLILAVESYFKKPVFINDTLSVSGTVEEKIEFGRIIVIKTEIKNQKGEVVLNGKMRVQLLK